MFIKKIKTIFYLIKQRKYDFLFYVIKKKFFKSDEHFVSREKKYLLKRYFYYFENGIVRTNFYKNSVFKFSAKSEINGFASKVLGYYEIEIQKELLRLQKKYKIKNFIQFGVADGYHLIGVANLNKFKNYFAFDISKEGLDIFKKNLKLNKKIKNLKIFLKKASFKFLSNYFSKKDKSLYLIDIEGDEFNLINNKNLRYFKNSILMIEIHDFENKKRQHMYKFLSNYFKIKVIELNNFKKSYKYVSKEIKNKFSKENLKYLIDDGRPDNMIYYSCVPKSFKT